MLYGDRYVETKWLIDNLKPGSVLDVGSFESVHVWEMMRRGHDIVLLDKRPFQPLPYPIEIVKTVSIDIRAYKPTELFDNVVCISTIEHIGMAAYGFQKEPNPTASQISAINKMISFLKPSGRLLITAPYGIHVDGGWYMVYDKKDVEHLVARIDGKVAKREFFTLVDMNRDIYKPSKEEDCKPEGLTNYRGIMRSRNIIMLVIHPIVTEEIKPEPVKEKVVISSKDVGRLEDVLDIVTETKPQTVNRFYVDGTEFYTDAIEQAKLHNQFVTEDTEDDVSREA